VRELAGAGADPGGEVLARAADPGPSRRGRGAGRGDGRLTGAGAAGPGPGALAGALPGRGSPHLDLGQPVRRACARDLLGGRAGRGDLGGPCPRRGAWQAYGVHHRGPHPRSSGARAAGTGGVGGRGRSPRASRRERQLIESRLPVGGDPIARGREPIALSPSSDLLPKSSSRRRGIGHAAARGRASLDELVCWPAAGATVVGKLIQERKRLTWLPSSAAEGRGRRAASSQRRGGALRR
jgi:hypothetical protein